MADAVNPDYYENGPFECILLAEQYSFNVGNMIKYVWRHKDKGHPKEDLQKALWSHRERKPMRLSAWNMISGTVWPKPMMRMSSTHYVNC